VRRLRILLAILALGIIGTMGVLFYSRYTSREFPPEISASEPLPENSLNNVHLVQQEVGKVKWVLNTKRVDAYDEERLLSMEGVNLLIITENEGRLRVLGDRGRYSKDSGDFWVSGNVKVISGKGYVLYSDAVHWDVSRQIIISDGLCRVEGPNGSITGKAMSVDVQKQRLYIKENVNAILN